MLIKVDWNIFRVNAGGDPEGHFEWLCYLLFCREHNRPIGVDRFFNQSALETEPITDGPNTVGWQAKFYDTPLRRHKADILKSIRHGSQHYGINKLVFYANRDWSQGKQGRPPVAKTEAESLALDLGVTLDWRTASFFESEFVVGNCKTISSSFFTLRNQPLPAVQARTQASRRLFNSIENSINYNNKELVVDRQSLLDSLAQFIESSVQPVMILHGSAGVGKSAAVKTFINVHPEVTVLGLNSSEFNTTSASDIFGGISTDSLKELIKDTSRGVLYIDSAERVPDAQYPQAFSDLVKLFVGSGWKVILSSRSEAQQSLLYWIQFDLQIQTSTIKVDPIEMRDLLSLSKSHSFELPESARSKDLLRLPFYLKLYLSAGGASVTKSQESFENYLWESKIRKGSALRSQVLERLALERAKQQVFYLEFLPPESQTVDELVNDGILNSVESRVFFAHDLYDDWALQRAIESQLNNSTSFGSFTEGIGTNASIARAVRRWLVYNLNNTATFGLSNAMILINELNGDTTWANEVTLGILQSNVAPAYLKNQRDSLISADSTGLKELRLLYNSSLKIIDYDTLFKLHGTEELFIDAAYIPTKPFSTAWLSLFQFALLHVNSFAASQYDELTPMIRDWLLSFKIGVATRCAGLLALQIFRVKCTTYKDYGFRNEDRDTVVDNVLMASAEIHSELRECFAEVENSFGDGIHSPFKHLVDRLLQKPFLHSRTFELLGDILLLIASLEYVLPSVRSEETDSRYKSNYTSDRSERFGLVGGYKYRQHPQSAHQSLIKWTFLKFPTDSILAVGTWADAMISKYQQSNLEPELQLIELSMQSKVYQFYVTEELWCAYRGSTVLPDIFVCALMAIEGHLLEIGRVDPNELKVLISELLNATNNGAILGMIVGVAIAYPFILEDILLAALHSRTAIQLDFRRKLNERMSRNVNRMALPGEELFQHERREADQLLEHRGFTLEDMGFRLQLPQPLDPSREHTTSRIDRIHAILDLHYSELDGVEEDEDVPWRMQLVRMDLRKMRAQPSPSPDGGTIISFVPELPAKLEAAVTAAQFSPSESIGMTPFFLWSEKAIEGEIPDEEFYRPYEKDELVLSEFHNIAEHELSNTEQSWIPMRATAANVAIILLRDRWDILNSADKDLILKVVLHYLNKPIDETYVFQYSDGCERVIHHSPLIVSRFPQETQTLSDILAVLTLSQSNGGNHRRLGAIAVKAMNSAHQNHPNFTHLVNVKHLYLLRNILDEAPQPQVHRYETYRYRTYPSLRKLLEAIPADLPTDSIQYPDLSALLLNEYEALIGLANPNKHVSGQADAILECLTGLEGIDRIDDEIRYGTFRESCGYFAKYWLHALQQDEQTITGKLKQPSTSLLLPLILKATIVQEDTYHKVARFWSIWKSLESHMMAHAYLAQRSQVSNDIVRSYLFSTVDWKSTTRSWDSLLEHNMPFFSDFINGTGYNLTTIGCYAKIANTIGHPFRIQFVVLISDSINSADLPSDYRITGSSQLDILCRRVCESYKADIRTNRRLRDKILVVLNYLYNHGSSPVAYQLRENIS